MRDFALTIADINALDPTPDVIVHTGDIVHNGRQDEYAQALAILKKARAPFYVLPGNKDDRANLRAAFSNGGHLAANGDFIDYTVENYPVRLIALDTLSEGKNRGEFRREQAEHLAALIDAHARKSIAVFTRSGQIDSTSRPWQAWRYCAMRCSIPGASSLFSAATSIVEPRDKSDASPRVWCRASRRRCARANILRT